MKTKVKNKKPKRNISAQVTIGHFFSNCSIRGVSKAYKTNSLVVKIVWIIFIILMIILLLYSIIKIVREYLEFNTTIQTKVEIQAASLFPAITICPYQPFSQRAVKFFESGGMSPKQFSQKLRKIAKSYLEKGQPLKAEWIIFYDDLRIYYQNLDYKDSINIGLNYSEIFVFCITKLKIGMFFGQVDSNCGYTITKYTTPEFFNCFTITMMPKYSVETEYIHIILRFPKPESLDKYRETALLKTLSQNIIGAQILVHESTKSPSSNKEKIHIEPNRLLQINYQNNQWKEYNTPTDICKSENLEGIIDLENQYSFSFLDCLSAYTSKRILEECKCIMAFLPRSVIPTKQFPYCANFGNITNESFEEFSKKTLCLNKVLLNIQKMSNAERNCHKKCDNQRFNLQISSINWQPSLWQLEWLYKLQESVDILIESSVKQDRVEAAMKTAMQFLNANSLQDLNSSDEDTIFHKDERYACVVLERLSNETFFNEERLGISLYGLVSRIGGSCTLYLGLTCAFIIEMLECVLIIWNNRTKNGNISESDELETEKDNDRLFLPNSELGSNNLQLST